MKYLIALIMTATLNLGLGTAIAQAQEGAGSLPPGHGARQAKAQHANARHKPKVLTNDGRVVSGTAPQVVTASSSPQPAARQDLGYVERADGQVEAIVVDGGFVSIVQESPSFAETFHGPVSAHTPTEVAGVSTPPSNPPASPVPDSDLTNPNPAAQDASGSPEAPAGVQASLQQPQPVPGDNSESQSEASATLQPEPLADYAGDQFRAKPPETLQAPPCSVVPAFSPQGGTTHSTVRPIGYVEKAGGEKEAIVEAFDQVYLVHEGELFAEKYRVLHVTPTSVEIVEEPMEASSEPPESVRYP